MKVDFRKVTVKGIDGEVVKNESGEVIFFDVSKELGQEIYSNTSIIPLSDLAKKIYYDGEVEISEEYAQSVIEHVKNAPFKAVFKSGIIELIQKTKENEKANTI